MQPSKCQYHTLKSFVWIALNSIFYIKSYDFNIFKSVSMANSTKMCLLYWQPILSYIAYCESCHTCYTIGDTVCYKIHDWKSTRWTYAYVAHVARTICARYTHDMRKLQANFDKNYCTHNTEQQHRFFSVLPGYFLWVNSVT